MKLVLSLLLGWVGALLFLLLGFLYYIFTYSVMVFFVTLLAVLMCAPPSRRFIAERTGVNPTGSAMAAVFIVLVIAQTWIGMSQNFEVVEEEKIQKELKHAQVMANARSRGQARFDAAKPALVASITALRDQGKLAEGLALIDASAVPGRDPDLDKLRASIHVIEAEAGLKDEAAVPLRQRLALYQRLAGLDPSSARYAGKTATLGAELKESSARERMETGRVSAARGRDAMLARQFDKRSGAHLKLQAEIRRTMLNPASYQHQETTHLDTGTGMSVWTTFRGRNAAGQMAENSVAAAVDDSGNVLTIED